MQLALNLHSLLPACDRLVTRLAARKEVSAWCVVPKVLVVIRAALRPPSRGRGLMRRRAPDPKDRFE